MFYADTRPQCASFIYCKEVAERTPKGLGSLCKGKAGLKACFPIFSHRFEKIFAVAKSGNALLSVGILQKNERVSALEV